MKINSNTKICMVIGDPVEHSIGPKLYNSIYGKLGMESEFVYVACRIKEEQLEDFVKGVRAMGIRGVSVTIPHKINIMKFLDKIDDCAKAIGAVNTIVNDDGILKGFNTDFLGIAKPLQKFGILNGKSAGIIGSGGAARAAAFAMNKNGVKFTVFNRTTERAEKIASDFGGSFESFENLIKIKNCDIIINSTPVGMKGYSNESILNESYISKNQIVFDCVYTPYDTELLKIAEKRKAKIIHGQDMLIHQGIEQFKLYTGKSVSEDIFRETLSNI